MKSREKILVSLLTVFLFAILSLFINLIHSSVFAEAEGISLKQPEAKIISSASIDNEFDEESVIVILNKEKTFEFKTYTPQDFTEFNCYEVIDLTWQTSELVKKQLEAEKIGGLSKLQKTKDGAMLVDTENFRRILKLKVKLTNGRSHAVSQIEEEHDLHKELILKSVKALDNRDDLIYAGPNYIYESAEVITPNDTEYKAGKQWAIKDIKLPEAWEITTGLSDIKVGIIDTGIDGTHEDLKNRLNNDLHRDFRGAKVTNIVSPFDTDSHGTHVAGIIGAESNNTFGITGTCWDVNIVSLLVSENGAWYSDNAILAVDHATANNIQVLNYSGRVRDRDEKINVNDPAFEQSIRSYPGLFVVAAGNENVNNDVSAQYPANYSLTLDNVISVGAIDNNNRKAEFSSYGEKTVNIYAPGVNIYSTLPNNDYDIKSGTSMAAPYVTGVAALLLSKDQTLTATELKSVILSSADDITIYIPGGSQNVKKLNAYTALQLLNYNVILDKQTGQGGDGGVNATFGEDMPSADAPTRTDYTFKGYFSQPNGGGDKYYGPDMGSIRKWDKNERTILYAYWEKVYYSVTLHYGGGTSGSDTLSVAYGEMMPFPPGRDSAPIHSGYEFVGFFSGENGSGTQYYSMEVHSGLDNRYYERLVPLRRWYSHSNGDLYGYWKPLECDYTYENVKLNDGYFDEKSTVHLKHGTTATITAKTFEGYKFLYFNRRGVEVPHQTVTWNMELKRSEDDGKVYPVDRFFAVYEKDSCLAQGSLITLADGSQVAVENLTGNETLLVWNLYTGTYDTAPILFIDSDPLQLYKVINLSFSDGTTVKVISEHGFWDYNLNKYVYLDGNAADYVGHWFNKGATRVQLTGVEITEEYTTPYSPVTYGHLCYYVNGMLSMPGGIGGLFNIFDVDAETMRYDETAMAADIEQYGLFTYEEFAELVPVSEEVFDAFNGRYLKIAIGKGLTDTDRLNALAERYQEFFV